MKKCALLFRVLVVAVAIVFLLSGTGLAANLQNENPNAPETTPDDYPSVFAQDEASACFGPDEFFLESDAPDEYVFQRAAGETIRLNYLVNSSVDADEYRIACSGENVTLLSPAEYSAAETGSYALEFLAPECGEGSVTLTLTVYSDGEIVGFEAHSYLYCSASSLGIFLSEYQEMLPELAMAKARFDADEITSLDYYNIIRSQPVKYDMDFLHALHEVASDNIEYNYYAAPYVEAVNKYVLGIESDPKVPDVNDTLNKMQEELGLAPDTETREDSPQLTPDSEAAVDGQSPAPDPEATADGRSPDSDFEPLIDSGNAPLQSSAASSKVTIKGRVMWEDVSGAPCPASYIKVEIVDINDDDKVIASGETNKFGYYSIDIEEGHDINVRVVAEGPNVANGSVNVKVAPSTSGDPYVFKDPNGPYNSVTLKNNPSPVVIQALQGKNDPDYMKAIQVQQASSLASRFASLMNKGDLSLAYVHYPINDSSHFNPLNGEIYIKSDFYNVWDVMTHEYGHFAEDKLGMVSLIILEVFKSHSFDRDLWDERSKYDAVRVAWMEGWATYFGTYAQNYMEENGYFGDYATGYGGKLSDHYYYNKPTFDIEDPSYRFGETNESSVAAVLWDLTDKVVRDKKTGKVVGEQFDLVERGFQELWGLAKDRVRLSDFIKVLNSKSTSSEKLDIGVILSEYKVSPRLTLPADGDAAQKRSNSPAFEWQAGGSVTKPDHPNNSFNLMIYDSTKKEIYRFNLPTITSLNFTLPLPNWLIIINNHGGSKLYWAVEGTQTTDDDTGPYMSNYHSFICPLQTPALKAVPGFDSITLSWDPVKGATGYEVWYTTNSNPNVYTSLGITKGTSMTRNNLVSGTTYYYYIVAHGTVDGTKIKSENSNVVSTAPYHATLTLNAAVEGGDSVSLSWTKVDAATGYELWRKTGQNGTYAQIPIPAGAGNVTYKDRSLLSETTYYYKVRAYITIGSNKSYTAFSDEKNVTIAAFSYELNPDNTLTITGYLGSRPDIVVPSVLSGKTVTAIGSYAFSNSGITKIVIPNSITSIGAGAFSNTAGLTSVTIPNSVTKIGEYAFSGSGITSITLPNKIKAISTGVFESSDLSGIVLPGSVTSIGERAFQSCNSLSSVTFSKNITDIGDYAFMECRRLKSITIPKSILHIGAYAFNSCTRLTSVKINSSSGECAIDIFAFSECTGLSTVNMSSVKSLGDFAFSGCSKMAKAVIKKVESVGTFAFTGCDSLKEASISSADTIGDYAFSDCVSLKKVSISDTRYIGMQAFVGCSNMLSAYINAKEIGTMAFMNCLRLKDLSLSGVKTIGLGAFIDCQSLKKVQIPKGTTTIGVMAFVNCIKLETVSLPKSLTSIGDSAFGACAKLKEIIIPGKVTYLGSNAFAQCTDLKKAVIPGSVPEISVCAFANCSNLSNVKLGNGIQSILQYAFAGCTSLTKIAIPSSVTYIDAAAFEGSGVILP